MTTSIWIFVVAIILSHYPSNGSAILPVANLGDDSYGIEENIVDGVGKSGMESSLEGCLRKDSISCLQMHVFRMAKNFFDQPSLKVLDDINISKTSNQANINGRSLMEQQSEERIETARGVEEREDALESYIVEQLGSFFENRNVKLNMENIGRSIANSTPESVKDIFKTLIEEGRGKKKVLRMLLPLLLGLKVKFASVVGLVYLGVILLAKKALVMALISIAISVFQLVKKMYHHGGESFPGHGYNGGWQSHIDVGHVEYAPQSSTVGQNLAYGGQQNAKKR